MTYYSIFNNMR